MTQLSNWATKYRPKSFDEVIGQGLTIQILENQIAKNEVMPAYLFIGGQGSGKTTTARLLASALDAEVIEIDAASNSGVDNIRQITEQCSYKSIHAKKKVYIIDEAHSVSKSGNNAFLKTLEDCHADVHFILCTTDPQKILPTVKSRCQIFEFKRPNFEDIESRLSMILRLEDVGGNWNNPHLPDYPLLMIAEKADYGVRDSIKIMQSCVVENSLDCHNVAIKLNILYERIIGKILKALVEKDVKALTIYLDQCAESDFRYVLKQLLERYSDYVIQNKENNSPEVWRSLYKIYIDLKDVENVNLIIMGALICLIK